MKIKKKKIKFKGRNSAGQFQKGVSGNPAGAPKKPNTNLDMLLHAVHRVEAKKGKLLLDHFVEQAYVNPAVLIALMKKIHPDLKAIEMSGGLESRMPDAEVKAIRDKLRKRHEEYEAVQKYNAQKATI